jgi:hypothetical protein
MTLLLRQPPQHQIHIHLLGCLDRLRATLDVSALVRIDVLSAWAGKRLDALLAVESAVRVRVLGADGRVGSAGVLCVLCVPVGGVYSNCQSNRLIGNNYSSVLEAPRKQLTNRRTSTRIFPGDGGITDINCRFVPAGTCGTS